jgi:hypothetical protein
LKGGVGHRECRSRNPNLGSIDYSCASPSLVDQPVRAAWSSSPPPAPRRGSRRCSGTKSSRPRDRCCPGRSWPASAWWCCWRSVADGARGRRQTSPNPLRGGRPPRTCNRPARSLRTKPRGPDGSTSRIRSASGRRARSSSRSRPACSFRVGCRRW